MVAFPKNVHFSLSFLFGFAVFFFQDITTKINGFFFFLIWLRQILVMALRILVASCGSFCCVTETLAGVMWAAVVEVGELSSWGTRAPEWGSAVWQSCGLSSSATCGILVPRLGIQPVSPTLQGRFVTAGPPRKSLNGLPNYQITNAVGHWKNEGLGHQSPSTTTPPVGNPCTTL